MRSCPKSSVGGGKPNAPESNEPIQRLEQSHERADLPGIPAVRIDVLAEEGNLLYPFRDQKRRFVENFSRRAAGLSAPHIGDDTIAAEIVASLHDGDLCGDFS